MAPTPFDDDHDRDHEPDDGLDDGLDHDAGALDGLLVDPVLGGFVADLRRLAEEPAPTPSPALAAVLAGRGPVVDELAERRRRRHMAPVRTVAGLSLAAKVTLGVGIAVAATSGAAAAGVLPGPVQDTVAEVVSLATPFELHGSPAEPSGFGQSVRDDATDDDPGVDGRSISDAARDASRGERPDVPVARGHDDHPKGTDDDGRDDDRDDDHDDDSDDDGRNDDHDDDSDDDAGHSGSAPRGVPSSTPVAAGGGAGPDHATGNVPGSAAGR
jgi:hypothetical protein